MYKLVVTNDEKMLFDQLYQPSFEEKGYELEEYNGEQYSYLVENKYGEYAGTVELIEFNQEKSMLANPQIFVQCELLEDAVSVWEVDKISVKAEERKNKTLNNIMETIYEICKEKQIEYLIAEMNPVLCRALKVEYTLDIYRLSGIVKGKYPYIPVIIPINQKVLEAYETNRAKKERVV